MVSVFPLTGIAISLRVDTQQLTIDFISNYTVGGVMHHFGVGKAAARLAIYFLYVTFNGIEDFQFLILFSSR